MTPSNRPRIGVSACLLGQSVRYDGGHKQNAFVTSALAKCADLVPVCPEVEAGLPVPREALRLLRTPDSITLAHARSGADETQRMQAWAEERVTRLAAQDLDGFVLKKDSPSCGLERVRVYSRRREQPPTRDGTGFFAAKLRERLTALPLTEEGWLNDAGLKESFLEQVFTHARMRAALRDAPSRAKLGQFHRDHKLLYLAHSPSRYRELGRLVAQAATRPLPETLERYAAQSMATLAVVATPGKHANVLQHALGYLKKVLTAFEKRELLLVIEDFRAGLHGLAVPLTLLSHHLHKHEVSGWLATQRYFQPYPKELAVR
ncbi:MAG: YbgA family protein [Deltaproteobacteria bacterium]